MSKKGISAVVATVLIVLITVAGVAVIWVGVLPILRESLDFSDLEGRVSVVGTGGYTVYDSSRGIASVQVKRDVDEGVMDRIKIGFIIDGNSVSSSVIAPGSGQTRVYNFDLSGYGMPDSVEVAPIFVSSTGREKEGSMSSEVKMPTGVISDVDGVVYNLGVDVVSDVPTDGLVSMWTFSGDADDGVGGNDGVVYGDASVVDGVLVLDGDEDWVDIPFSSSLDFSGQPFSFSYWVKIDEDGLYTAGYIFSNYGGNYKGFKNYYSYNINDIGSVFFQDSTTWESSNTDVLPFDTWENVVVVYDSAGRVNAYLNGELQDTSPSLVFDFGTNLFRVGMTSWASTYCLKGEVDDLMMFGKELSEDEVLAIYEAQMKS